MVAKKKVAQLPSGVYTEYMRLGALKPHPQNPKEHDVGAIWQSIDTFGFVGTLTMDEGTGYLVEGHGRLETLQAMEAEPDLNPPDGIKLDADDGAWLVPVSRGFTFAGEDAVRAFLVASNRLVTLGGWNEPGLAQLLQDLQTKDEALLQATGYDPDDLQYLLAGLHPPDLSGDATTRGLTPGQKLDTFLNATIKQIVLYFGAEEFNDVVSRLAAVRLAERIETNTEAVVRLLESYENLHNPGSKPETD